jgi:antitoxin (DNA-binding transcriptional repressor) of toxin-antitoxin stability system
MKFVGVREAQAGLSAFVEESQRERIVLTRHGQPVAILTGVEGKDLEDVLLAQDPGFRQLIEERRRYKGPLVSQQALEEEAARDLARERRGAGSRRPRRRRRAAKK